MNAKEISFKIEKKIPMPIGRSELSRKYPFDKMQIGDSFEFPKEIRIKVRYAATAYGIKHQKKFTCRSNRVWRTA
jgi:hypothetical protein